MIQQIPLNGGLVTQVDGEEVSVNACTELINAEFDKPGVIYKRKGSATGVDTNITFVSIIRWYNPNLGGDYRWIGIDDADNVWQTNDSTTLTGWTEIGFTPAITADAEVVKLVNYNTQLRFPCGLTDDARIYQYIDRDFFWSAEEGTPAFYTDIARPRDIIADQLTGDTYVVTNHNWLKEGGTGDGDLMFTGINTSTIDYYYKYALVFDGNQEAPLSAPLDDTTGGTGTIIPYLQLEFDVGASLANWNKRITGLNIYRATSFDGAYYKVLATSTKSNDANIKKVTDVTKDVGVHVPGGSYSTNAYASDKLVNRGTFANIASNTADILTLSAILKDTNTTVPLATDVWGSTDMVISDSVLYAHTCDNTTGLASAGTMSVDTSEKKWGASSVKDTGTACAFNTASITLPSATSLTLEWWGWVNDNGSGANKTWKIIVIDDASGIANYDVPNGNLTPSGIGGPYGVWQKYKAVFTLASGWNGLTVKFYIGTGVTGSTASDHMRIDGISLYKTPSVTIATGCGGFTGAYTSESLALGSNNSHRGELYQRGAGGQLTDERGFILKNSQKAIQVSTENSFPVNSGASGTNLIICQNYLWMENSNSQRLFYVDQGADGVTHLTGDTSLDVKHRHSKYINGRNYVADVRITDGTDTEDHDNWIMFSELNKPDVIPITNYIQLTDAQGGKIVGIESLMGDLAVLMENGIFRLSIPSADPTQWSLSESEENIGCASENSITAWEGGLFFAGKDHLYYLDVNFKATPVTASIKDDYQGLINENARTFYDVKKNRLLCRFGSDGATVYSLDLSAFPEERWTKATTGSGDMDIFTLNENLALYSYDETTQYIKLHDDSKSESTSFKRTTGWVSQANIDRSGVLRRLNLKYNSGDAITAKIYIDGDDSTVVSTITIPADTSGADWYKCKPNVRCRSYKIELSTASSTNDVEIRRLEVEFE